MGNFADLPRNTVPGVIRKSKRFELFLETSGMVTIRRFTDGHYEFLSEPRAEFVKRSRKEFETVPESVFDYWITAELQKVQAQYGR